MISASATMANLFFLNRRVASFQSDVPCRMITSSCFSSADAFSNRSGLICMLVGFNRRLGLFLFSSVFFMGRLTYRSLILGSTKL